MIEEMIIQAQTYISQRYLPWSLAAIGLLVGSIFVRGVDHHLGRFFRTVDYDLTLEILCQRSVKWFLWIVLISQLGYFRRAFLLWGILGGPHCISGRSDHCRPSFAASSASLSLASFIRSAARPEPTLSSPSTHAYSSI